MSAGYNYSRPPVILVEDVTSARSLEGLKDNQQISIKDADTGSSGEYFYDASSSAAESLPDVIVTNEGARLVRINVDVSSKTYTDSTAQSTLQSANQYTDTQVEALPVAPDTTGNANTVPRVLADESGYVAYDLGTYGRYAESISTSELVMGTPVYVSSNSLPSDIRDIGREGFIKASSVLVQTNGPGTASFRLIIESATDATITYHIRRTVVDDTTITENLGFRASNPTQIQIPITDYSLSTVSGPKIYINTKWEAGPVPGTYLLRAHVFSDDISIPTVISEGTVFTTNESPLEVAGISKQFGGATFDNGQPETQYSVSLKFAPLLT